MFYTTFSYTQEITYFISDATFSDDFFYSITNSELNIKECH